MKKTVLKSFLGYQESGYTMPAAGVTAPVHVHNYWLDIDDEKNGEVDFDGGWAYDVADHSHRITLESIMKGETEPSDGHVHRLMPSALQRAFLCEVGGLALETLGKQGEGEVLVAMPARVLDAAGVKALTDALRHVAEKAGAKGEIVVVEPGTVLAHGIKKEDGTLVLLKAASRKLGGKIREMFSQVGAHLDGAAKSYKTAHAAVKDAMPDDEDEGEGEGTTVASAGKIREKLAVAHSHMQEGNKARKAAHAIVKAALAQAQDTEDEPDPEEKDKKDKDATPSAAAGAPDTEALKTALEAAVNRGTTAATPNKK